MRVKSKFDCGDWYEERVRRMSGGRKEGRFTILVSSMTMVMKRNAIGQCDWPDNDIVIVGRELVEEKKAKKVKSGGSVIKEIGGIGVGIARNNLVERMFSYGEPGCQYEIKIDFGRGDVVGIGTL